MKKILAIVLVLIMMLSFAGCGGKKTEGSESVAGTYKWGAASFHDEGRILVINSDNTATYCNINGGSYDSFIYELKWAKTESTIYFTKGLEKYACAKIIDGGLICNGYDENDDSYSPQNRFFEKIA